jgi:hypothetical protein
MHNTQGKLTEETRNSESPAETGRHSSRASAEIVKLVGALARRVPHRGERLRWALDIQQGIYRAYLERRAVAGGTMPFRRR